MNERTLDEIQNNEIVRKRLAKLIAVKCFRWSSKLEDLHGGKYPTSLSEDYSDVKVVTPTEEIPWNRLSRVNNDEMKEIMIEAVNLTYTHLTELFGPGGDEIIEKLKQIDKVPRWNEPEFVSRHSGLIRGLD